MSTKLSTGMTFVFFLLFHSVLVFAQQAQQPVDPRQPPWGWPGPWHMWGGGWGFWWVCPLVMMLLIIVCAAIFLRGWRWGGGQDHWGPPWHMTDRPGSALGDPTYTAMQILNERLAKGEIQKQEYEEKKATILSK
jgi:putative membrane protein